MKFRCRETVWIKVVTDTSARLHCEKQLLHSHLHECHLETDKGLVVVVRWRATPTKFAEMELDDELRSIEPMTGFTLGRRYE